MPPPLQERVAALRLPPGEATLAAIRDALHDWRFDRDRVRPAVAPTIPHHCSDAFILGCADLARDFEVGLHSHVAEFEGAGGRPASGVYGETQTAHLDRLGVLGPHFTVAHGVWLDHDDMARLGDHGASVAHNPGSNMRLGSGLADTRAMLERRVNLGIGTDGANCSDNQNMYEAMRLASFVSKVQGPEWQRWLTTREAALAATEGSARALGFGDRIGRHRARLQGRHRHARPRPPELAAAQRPGQPAGPYRGRHRGRQRHDRRPPGGRQPARR